MRIITREIDIAPGGVPAYISLNQYDSLFRLSLTPFCSDGSVALATDGTGAVCTIRGTKTDGTIYTHTAAFDGTTVTVYGDVQITAVAGRQVFEIVFWNADQSKELATANIIISVERAAADIDSVASDSVVRELYDIADQTDQIIAEAQNLQGLGFKPITANLYDSSTLTAGYKWDSSGAQTADASFSITDWIPVSYLKAYYYTGSRNHGAYLVYADADKTVLSARAMVNANTAPISVPIANPLAVYVSFSLYTGEESAFYFYEREVPNWAEALTTSTVAITSSTYEAMRDILDAEPNRIYAITSTVTDTMVLNLPIYGVNMTALITGFSVSNTSGRKIEIVTADGQVFYNNYFGGVWSGWTEGRDGEHFVSTCVPKPLTVTAGQKLLIIGDSIATNRHAGFTWGSIVCSKVGWIEGNVAVRNSGFTRDGDLALINQVTGVSNWSNVELVLVAAGTNDRASDAATLKTKVQEVITAIRSYTSAPVIFITPIRRFAANLDWISAVIASTALANDCGVVDGSEFPIPNYDSPDGLFVDLTDDGLHPGADGTRVYAKAVLNALF